jgi:hypothetical protein
MQATKGFKKMGKENMSKSFLRFKARDSLVSWQLLHFVLEYLIFVKTGAVPDREQLRSMLQYEDNSK